MCKTNHRVHVKHTLALGSSIDQVSLTAYINVLNWTICACAQRSSLVRHTVYHGVYILSYVLRTLVIMYIYYTALQNSTDSIDPSSDPILSQP